MSGEWAAKCQHYTAALEAMDMTAREAADASGPAEIKTEDVPFALRTFAPALYSNRSAAEAKLGKYRDCAFRRGACHPLQARLVKGVGSQV